MPSKALFFFVQKRNSYATFVPIVLIQRRRESERKAMEGNRAVEAERWLSIAEKLLAARDLQGCKTFAIRARESDPRQVRFSDQILAVADALIAGEARINNQNDWYAILQLSRRTQDPELVATQYRRLALLLNPDQNRLPFADQAFRLVADAWSVLSNQAKKALYDDELSLLKLDPSADSAQPARTPRTTEPTQSLGPCFWTACPYCYNLYEYPRVYEECVLRCQNCQRAFHAVRIPSPPAVGDGKDGYFCCWGFFPLGFSVNPPENAKTTGGYSNWVPFSPMFACPSQYEELKVLWHGGALRRRRAAHKVCWLWKKGVKELGKLDLNVEFSNEVEEAAVGISEGNGEEDNIEGISFFEGLDEFLSSLPILSVVGDDKVKAA
ncbi:unnamed protein product, partial [Vitis vinifera]